ncbi:Hypothetical protein CINCED_3A022726 [Cinara cedri]|uniref:Reverse transcriptase domain n=1 Tax=Cinara cedri TaxID=506608 RepID=A0A5E4MER8_9HEMI|nr:Hypothetical protein CINCED_3A022726 [Cinara cedri]
MGIVINENKTKYVVMNRNTTVKDNLCIKELTFKQVGDLGSFQRKKIENLQQLYSKQRLCLFLARKRLEWVKHIWRTEGSLIKKVMGKRPRGRPQQRWYDIVKKTMKEINSLLDMEVALNRERWKWQWF